MLKEDEFEQLLRVGTGTQHRYFATIAKRRGQYTSLVVYDPRNRGSDFVVKLLLAAGLDFDINDEGEPVTLPQDGVEVEAWVLFLGLLVARPDQRAGTIINPKPREVSAASDECDLSHRLSH